MGYVSFGRKMYAPEAFNNSFYCSLVSSFTISSQKITHSDEIESSSISNGWKTRLSKKTKHVLPAGGSKALKEK